MATYPLDPGPRIAWDWDGTYVYFFANQNSAPSPLDMDVMKWLNSENDADVITLSTGQSLVFKFPSTYNLDGYFLRGSGYLTLDQTYDMINWNNIAANHLEYNFFYRDNIDSLTASYGIKALRVSCGTYNSSTTVKDFFLYGKSAYDDGSNVIAFWEPLIDYPLGAGTFDWGDVGQGSSADKMVRIKNLGVNTAASVTLTLDTMTDTDPSVLGQYLFSTDGVTFTGGLTLPSINPGTISPPIFVRRVTPTDAALGLQSVRILATVGEWQ